MLRYAYSCLLVLIMGCSAGLFGSCYKSMSANGGKVDSVSLVVQPLADILQNNPDFHDFDTLLKKSGLFDRVTSADSVFTLLVATDEAFVNAGVSVDSLLALSADSLQAFVGYHIVSGSYPTSAIPQQIDNAYPTLSGQTIYFSKPLTTLINGSAYQYAQGSKTLNVNGVTTLQVDVATTTGYIQVLSAPLPTPYKTVQAFLAARPEYTYFVAALKRFYLWDQLDSAGSYTVFAPVNSAFVNNGIVLDSIISGTTFDSTYYQPYLYSACIIRSRFFLTDLIDGDGLVLPLGTYDYPTVYSASGSVSFTNVGNSYYPPPTPTAYNYQTYCQGCTGFIQIGGNPGYTMTNQPAGNGIVNGINDLLVDTAYVNKGELSQQ